MQAVDAQPWDPAVKALTQFPSVLGNLAENLTWTSSLGEAYHTQAADVMAASPSVACESISCRQLEIRTATRSRATVAASDRDSTCESAGGLRSHVQPRGGLWLSLRDSRHTSRLPSLATAVVAFGVGIAVGAMMASGCCAWGYSSWNCGWHGTTAVVYHGGSILRKQRMAWRVLRLQRLCLWSQRLRARYSTGYNPSTGTYARGGTVSNGYGSQSAGQAYNPKTGAYGATEQGSNANGSWGSSTASKNGTTVNSQHQTNANGTTGADAQLERCLGLWRDGQERQQRRRG